MSLHNVSSMDRPVGRVRGSRPVILAVSAVLLLVLIAALVPSLRRWWQADVAVDASTIRYAEVVRGDLNRDLSVQARVVASLHPTLFSPAQGIVSLKTKAGSQVRRGDILATIESTELRSALEQSRSSLLSARADFDRQRIVSRQSGLRTRQQVDLLGVRLEAAKRQLTRQQTLFAEGLANKADLEAAQDTVRVTSMELEQAKRELQLSGETDSFEVQNRQQQYLRQQSVSEELQRQYDQLTIRAPFDGMVASVTVQDRDAIGPNRPVLTVVNLSQLELEASLPEEYAAGTSIGTPASVSVSGRDYEGRVTAISPEVVNSQVIATIDFVGERPPQMMQSQRVTVRLVFEARKGVLKVQRGSFLESGGGRIAYVVNGGMATRREIQTGSSSVGEIEIVRGLKEGERIVVSDTSAFSNKNSVLLR